ncbi:hypothetical protein ACDI60_27210, partial [Klebsiella pneumoniae]|uniref:hypothetical protein n=1 Tax=Klebsiella pneumoniae TaxID=573 RepID=UPI003531FD3A
IRKLKQTAVANEKDGLQTEAETAASFLHVWRCCRNVANMRKLVLTINKYFHCNELHNKINKIVQRLTQTTRKI